MPYHLATPQSQSRRNVATNAGAIKPEQNRIRIICPFIPGQCQAGWLVRALEPGRNRPDAVPRKGLGDSGGIIAIVKKAETGRPTSRHLRGDYAIAVTQPVKNQGDVRRQGHRGRLKIVSGSDNIGHRP